MTVLASGSASVSGLGPALGRALAPAGRWSAPTLDDVARRAGVSRATASRCLNGSQPVSPDTRRRIEGAVAELGYASPQSAAAVAGPVSAVRPRTVALLVAPRWQADDALLAGTVRGAMRELAAVGFGCLTLPATPGDPHGQTRQLRGYGVRGVLVADTAREPMLTLLAAAGLPAVLVGASGPGGGPGDTLGAAAARRLLVRLDTP